LGYKKYDYLQSARHDLAFQLREEYKDVIYLAVNFPNFISKEIADMLFGQPPTIQVESTKNNEKLQMFIDDLISENHFYQMLWESVYDNSALGDNLMTARVNDEGKVEITPLDAMSWSPTVSRLERHNITSHTFFYNFVTEEDGKARVFVWKKEYLPGRIVNSAYEYIAGKPLIPVPMAMIDASIKEEEILEAKDPDGKDILLPTHIPNFKTPRSIYGVSDYRDWCDLIYEINNRLSQMGNILDIHSAPDTVVPDGTMDEVGNMRKSTTAKNRGMIFEAPTVGGGVDLVKKLTWDAKLDNAFEEIKMLVEFLASVGETDRETLAKGDNASPESGRALRYKLRKLIAKAKRRAVVYEHAIQQILAKACWLEGYNYVYPREIKVTANIDVPRDEQEEAELVQTWINAGLMSKEDGVMRRMKGKPDEQIQAELKRIKGEEKESAGNNPFIKPFAKGEAKDEDEEEMDGKMMKGKKGNE